MIFNFTKILPQLMLVLFLLSFTPLGIAGNGPDVGKPINGQKSGQFINIKMSDIGSTPRSIMQFHFTNDRSHEDFVYTEDTVNNPDYPHFLVSLQKKPLDHWGAYEVKRKSDSPVIIDDQGSIDSYISGSCLDVAPGTTGCTNKIKEIAGFDFDNSGDIRNRCGDDGANFGDHSCTINFDTGSYENRDYDGRCPIIGINNPCLDPLEDGDYDDHDPNPIFQAYEPAGEIIVAASSSSGISDYTNYEFHICFGSQDGASNDKIVYFEGKDEGNINAYQCNSGFSSGGFWSQVPECRDGLNNDRDKDNSFDYESDNPDPNCTDTEDNDEGSGGSSGSYLENNYPCPAEGVITQVTQEDLEASTIQDLETGQIRTIYENDQGSCEWGRTVKEFNGVDNSNKKMPVEFVCDQNGAQSKSGKYDEFCNRPLTHHPDNNDASVLAVEYYPDAEYFKTRFKDSLKSGVTTSDVDFPGIWFINEGDGDWQTGMQTLHQAEKFYSSDDNFHNAQLWSGKGLMNTESYASYNDKEPDPTAFRDSWDIANSGKNIPSIDNNTFHGGYHGLCHPGNAWTYNNQRSQWTCTGKPGTINIGFYEVNPVEEDYVGFKIDADEIAKWEQVFGVSPLPTQSDIGNVQVKARCWQGLPRHRPNQTYENKIVTIIKDITVSGFGSEETNIIGANLPDRDGESWSDATAQIIGQEEYSCNFGFEQRFDEYIDLPGVDYSFAGGELVAAGDTGPYFIVAGSNDVRPLRVSTSNLTSPGQDVLQNAANNAELGVTGEAYPFTHFPVAAAGSDVESTRQPYEIWRDRYKN